MVAHHSTISTLNERTKSLGAQVALSKLMLKRLNFIQHKLDGYDPVETKLMYKSKVENKKNQRIWELWRQELNEKSVKDIAVQVDSENRNHYEQML